MTKTIIGQPRTINGKSNPEYMKLYNKKYQRTHRELVREHNRYTSGIFRLRLKLEVLFHYSNGLLKCACCGETEMEFLTIDHIHGDGNKERKKIGYGGLGFYYWLKKNGFPEGYQVLCYSCNLGRAINNGICPHKGQGIIGVITNGR